MASKKKSTPSKSPKNTQAATPKFIVGIGSSAGGLEALRSLFGALEGRPNMSFIVVQHLAPQHRSRLVEILGHSTKLKVKEIEDNEKPLPHIIYITPPNSDLHISDGKLKLSEPHMKIGPKPSIDYFFKSLADSYAEAAIGVILSGTGSDGSHGIRAIKAAGGFTMAQSSETAKYDSMPRAAIQTGSIDVELSPEKIASELMRFDSLKRIPTQTKEESIDSDPYEEILHILDQRKGASFVQYKQSTVRRRIERRIIATRCENAADYLDFLKKSTQEADELFQDILISVTAFFRDPQAFEALTERIQDRVNKKENGSTFRCWVIGCATGEEAYSIAILTLEAIAKSQKNIRLQIFATDLDEKALLIGRRGLYPRTSLQDFPGDLQEKYFTSVDDKFQVKSFLRETILFAKHNVIEDPPFVSTDLVSCRNLLIYFTQKLQEKVFKTIHYSLNKKAILFLGRSETVPSPVADLFEMLDKYSKIFVCQDCKTEFTSPSVKSSILLSQQTEYDQESSKVGAITESDLFRSMIFGFAPDSIVIDELTRVQHSFGKANTYLRFPSGEPTNLITRLLPEELSVELTSLIHRSQKVNAPARGRKHELMGNDGLFSLQMTVAPLVTPQSRRFLIAFHSSKIDESPAAGDQKVISEMTFEERVKQLEDELLSAKEHLQAVNEEYETSNEELQSVNEELQSANEELQSSNEELETTNEELQSTNEELTTLNQELNVKSTEMQVLSQRHQAIQNAIVYPLLIVDQNMQVIDFNPAAGHMLRLNNSDLGCHLRSIPTPIDIIEIITNLEKAFHSNNDRKVQFKAKDRSFEIQIQIFKGLKDKTEGAVISFVDNTEISNVLNETQLIKGRLSSIIDNTPTMISMKDLSGVYMFVNERFCQLTDSSREDLIGQTDEELFGSAMAKSIRERDLEVLKQEGSLQFEETYEIDGQTRYWTSAKFALRDQKRLPYSICTISLDITDRVVRERQLELFRQAISSANSGTILLEDSGEGLQTTFCSEQFSEQLGFSCGEMIGLNLTDLFKKLRIQDSPKHTKEAIKNFESETAAVHTFSVPSGEGLLTLEIRSSTLKKDESRKQLILSIFDVTQRLVDQRTILAQQEELTRYSRLSALGEIAAGISHEINTPLNVITTKTDLIKKAVSLGRLDDQKAHKIADDIDKMVKGISNIVLGLKSAVGIDPESYESASVQKIIEDALKICEFRVQRFGVELHMNMPEDELVIDCYPVQVMQIIINLINNSVDEIQEQDDPWISIEVKSAKERAIIIVQDSGKGIDPCLAEKIMTPFFTTKKKNGTGIGLSLSRSIARRHNGELMLDPDQPHTTFRLELGLRQPND